VEDTISQMQLLRESVLLGNTTLPKEIPHTIIEQIDNLLTLAEA
jgi:hypothetical protein